jgi:hypothetical protein
MRDRNPITAKHELDRGPHGVIIWIADVGQTASDRTQEAVAQAGLQHARGSHHLFQRLNAYADK